VSSVAVRSDITGVLPVLDAVLAEPDVQAAAQLRPEQVQLLAELPHPPALREQ
jgi:hypothetical protein